MYLYSLLTLVETLAEFTNILTPYFSLAFMPVLSVLNHVQIILSKHQMQIKVVKTKMDNQVILETVICTNSFLKVPIIGLLMSIYNCIKMSFPSIPQRIRMCFSLFLFLDIFHCEYVKMCHSDWDMYIANKSNWI